MDITIITVVQNDSGLIVHMIDSVYRYSKSKPKIIICDNGGNKHFLNKYALDANVTIVKNKPKAKDAANKHGEGIDKIFQMVDTKYTVIMDSDCVILGEKWQEFDKNKYKVVTAKKGSKGGIDKHHFCFVMFETDIFKGISFKPVHSRQSRRLPWDTGCMMSQKIYDENIPIENLKVVGCDSGNGKVFEDRFPKSFELWRNDEPIVAHFGAGSDLMRRRVNKYGEGYPKQFSDWKATVVKHMSK